MLKPVSWCMGVKIFKDKKGLLGENDTGIFVKVTLFRYFLPRTV